MACTAGYYCSDPGAAAPRGQCFPGYYCLEGETRAQPPATLRRVFFDWLVTRGRKRGGCVALWRGVDFLGVDIFQTPVLRQRKKPLAVCPFGYYCPRGSATWLQCPPGTYSAWTGQYVCRPCPRGQYCDVDPLNRTVYIVPRPCPPGYYCLNGTRAATQWPCPVGTAWNGASSATAPVLPHLSEMRFVDAGWIVGQHTEIAMVSESTRV